jgi:hypothetical protein
MLRIIPDALCARSGVAWFPSTISFRSLSGTAVITLPTSQTSNAERAGEGLQRPARLIKRGALDEPVAPDQELRARQESPRDLRNDWRIPMTRWMRKVLALAAGGCLLLFAPSVQGQTLYPNQGCTVFLVSDGEMVLVGNNEDWRDPVTKVWFVPPAPDRFGRIYFGYGDMNPQGGMNDKGLFFDGLAVAPTGPVPEDGKPVFSGNLADKALAECATVDCVIEMFDTFHRPFTNAQLFFGDAEGNSVIIEPRAILAKDGAFQVATNFFQSVTNTAEWPGRRYRTATDMLREAGEVSVELARDILSATHQRGPFPTQYSNVYDLKRRKVFLYHFHNFNEVVEIDLAAELEKGGHVFDLPSLFPPNQEGEAWAAASIALMEGERLAMQGRVPEALSRFESAEIVAEILPIPAYSWNILCWTGSIWNYAEEVIGACDKAVAMGPDVAAFRDSRGIARALTGDLDGAIEDFEAFLAGPAPNTDRRMREEWMNTLRRGDNPITPEVQRSLRGG